MKIERKNDDTYVYIAKMNGKELTYCFTKNKHNKYEITTIDIANPNNPSKGMVIQFNPKEKDIDTDLSSSKINYYADFEAEDAQYLPQEKDYTGTVAQMHLYTKDGQYYRNIDGKLYPDKAPMVRFGSTKHYIDDEITDTKSGKNYVKDYSSHKYISSDGEEITPPEMLVQDSFLELLLKQKQELEKIIPKKIKTSKEPLEEKQELSVENNNGVTVDDGISL